MYFNMFQEGRLLHQFELRTSVDPESLAGTVRQIVRDVLKTVPVKTITTLAEQVDSNIVPERLIATLSGYFGAWPPYSPASGFMGSWRTRWRGGPTRSASGWRLAHRRAA